MNGPWSLSVHRGDPRPPTASVGGAHFRQANLLDKAVGDDLRGQHFIFCRNVLIYFDDESRRQALSLFPVILCTTLIKEADRRAGTEAGADAYITKPPDAVELVSTIERLLA